MLLSYVCAVLVPLLHGLATTGVGMFTTIVLHLSLVVCLHVLTTILLITSVVAYVIGFTGL
jgi:hypothetical protein